MSKIDSISSKPASGLNRRGLLRGASGIAAAGALSATAVALPTRTGPSAPLVEYRRCKVAWMTVPPYEEDEAWEARVDEAGWNVEAAIAPFLDLAKAPRSWNDIGEIAEVLRTELFEVEDGELVKHSDHEEIDTMLLRAVLALSAGGANV